MAQGVFLETLLFFALNLLAASAAVMLALRVFRSGDTLHFFFAVVAGYLLIAYFAVLLPGVLGVLSAIAVLSLLILVNALIFWWPGFPRGSLAAVLHAVSRHEPGAERPDHSPDPAAAGIAIALVTVFVLPPVLRLLLKGPGFSSDDLSYHAPAVAQWLLDGRFSFVGSSLSTYYPFNSELISLWFMIPFHADGFVGLAALAWMAVLALAVTLLTRRLGLPRSVAAICVAVILASPVVATSATRFSAVDFAGPVAMLGAFIFFLEYRVPSDGGKQQQANLLYGGLLAGFAAGVKVPLAIPSLLFVLWVLAAGGTRKWRAALVTVLAMSAACGYWYIRNMASTGNPIYPAQALIFHGPFGAAEQSRTKLITWIVAGPLNIQQWKTIALSLLDWPMSFGLLAIAGYVGTLAVLVRRSPLLSGQERRMMWLLTLIGLAAFLLFPFMPFSGTDNAPQAPLRVEARFVILPFVIGMVLWTTLLWRLKRGAIIFFALSLAAAIGAWDGQAMKLSALMVLAAVVVLAAGRIWRTIGKFVFSLRGVGVLGLGAFGGLLLFAPTLQRGLDAELFSYQVEGHSLGQAWQVIDGLPPASRIACIGSATQHYYPVFGRQLDKVPVSVKPDGTAPLPLHAIVRSPGDTATYWSPEPALRLDGLVANLRGLHVDYVLVAQEQPGVWPGQFQVLQQTQGVTQVFNNGYASIWKMGEGK